MFEILGRPRAALMAAASVVALVAIVSPASAQEQLRAFDIPPQSLSDALVAFSNQSQQMIIVDQSLVRGKSAPAVQGSMTSREALARLLAGSGVTATPNGERGFVLANTSSPTQLGADGQSASSIEGAETITVTGTRIRGANPTAPVHFVDREEIEQSGYGTVGEVLRALPENWSGGQNPAVQSGSNASLGNQNVSNASTVNLRGLGSDATLTLLNGRRLAGDSFLGVDISGIPLAAIDRVEIVTDGASAIYGSDAVAGVANFILRDDYNGAELSARAGGATQGGAFQQTYGALFGRAGENWHALVNLEYENQDDVTAGDRDFTSTANPRHSLVRPYWRQAAVFDLGVDLTDRLSVGIDGMYSRRDVDRTWKLTPSAARTDNSFETENYSVGAHIDYALTPEWDLGFVASWAGNDQQGYTTSTTNAGAVSRSATGYQFELASYELSASGTLFELPTGAMRVAFGGGYRTEASSQRNLISAIVSRDGERDVSYIYGEALAPLISPSNARPGLNELELSLSARAEDYSDFGSTANPRVGLRYAPSPDFSLRGTWGTSFKAPSFSQSTGRTSVSLWNASSFGSSTPGLGIMTTGPNAHLDPEESESWTLGAEFHPTSAPSMVLSATYFNIDFTNRVVQPVGTYTVAATNPIYWDFVTFNPSASDVSAIVSAADVFNNFSGQPYNPSNVIIFVENRYMNATSQTAEGVDLAYRQTFPVDLGDLDVFANASWLDLAQQTTPSAQEQALSGTIYNPPDFKSRAGLTWRIGEFSATGVVNYTSAGVDTGVTPNRDIDALTTIDTTLSYRFGDEEGLAPRTRLSFSVSNLLDEDPPYVLSPHNGGFNGIYFDGTNSSPLGRFVSLTLTTSW